jgi:hypothetical protein
MTRAFLAVVTLLASNALGGCFSDDNGQAPDASFPFPDTYVPEPETGADTSVPETGPDASPDVGVDSPREATPDVTTEAEPQPEASVDAGVESGLDATMDTGPDVSVVDVAAEPPGCTKATDCPPSFACNTSTGQCVTTCGAPTETACNGGCCYTGQCAAGTENGACGNNGQTCVGCANATPTCSPGGVCGATCGHPTDGPCGAGSCCQGNACVTAGNTPVAWTARATRRAPRAWPAPAAARRRPIAPWAGLATRRRARAPSRAELRPRPAATAAAATREHARAPQGRRTSSAATRGARARPARARRRRAPRSRVEALALARAVSPATAPAEPVRAARRAAAAR